MRILVLGGTVFLGRHVVEAALAGGHEVTLFNRGRHNPHLFPEVEKLRGDRDGGLSPLEGRRWDSVVDTSGYVPRIVGASADLLADACEHYTFISSVSVYAEPIRPGTGETAPVMTLADESEDVERNYGALKALCEEAVEKVFPGRALNVRAGLIVGPYDPTNRFTYWVARLARGGDVLAPGPRDQPVQLVDARDLAEWVVGAAERRSTGVFNATGPASPLTMEAMLVEVRAALGSDARLVWVDERFLVQAGVEPWSELPLWLAPKTHAEVAGLLSMDVSKAISAGLRFRAPAETVQDTLAWARSDAPTAKEYGVVIGKAGLAPKREAELLAAWRSRVA